MLAPDRQGRQAAVCCPRDKTKKTLVAAGAGCVRCTTPSSSASSRRRLRWRTRHLLRPPDRRQFPIETGSDDRVLPATGSRTLRGRCTLP